MEQVAKAAQISRPGLYFLFASKEELFRAAVTHTLEQDLARVANILTAEEGTLATELLEAFDTWAGRYIGPVAGDITTVIEENPEILGDVAITAPRRFADLLVASLAERAEGSGRQNAVAIAQTLISASIGLKHQVDDRAMYLERMKTAIDLVLA